MGQWWPQAAQCHTGSANASPHVAQVAETGFAGDGDCGPADGAPAITGDISNAAVASGTLTRLGNFPSAFQFFPPGTYRLVIDTDMTADLTVAQANAFGM